VTVLERFRHHLAALRSAGHPFDSAWAVAIDAVVPAGADPDEWRPVLSGTRHYWQVAYDRRPARRRERAVLAVDPARQRDLIAA
jgi:hypothetical protein